jgi:hypothetical protein
MRWWERSNRGGSSAKIDQLFMSVEILGVKLELKQYAVADACAAW